MITIVRRRCYVRRLVLCVCAPSGLRPYVAAGAEASPAGRPAEASGLLCGFAARRQGRRASPAVPAGVFLARAPRGVLVAALLCCRVPRRRVGPVRGLRECSLWADPPPGGDKTAEAATRRDPRGRRRLSPQGGGGPPPAINPLIPPGLGGRRVSRLRRRTRRTSLRSAFSGTGTDRSRTGPARPLYRSAPLRVTHRAPRRP